MSPPRPWTPAELQVALDMKAGGASTSQIGDRLQRSGNAILKALRRAGLPNIKFVQVWSDADSQTARRMWEVEGKSAAEIGRVIGRTRNSVLGMMHRQGWRPHKSDTQVHALACTSPRRDRPKRKPPASVLKFGGVRMSPDIKPPAPSALVEPALENAVTLGARTPRMCCFPVGDAGGADQLYCGGDKTRGDYCAFHHGVMYARRAA